jgi:hypothetical protein
MQILTVKQISEKRGYLNQAEFGLGLGLFRLKIRNK